MRKSDLNSLQPSSSNPIKIKSTNLGLLRVISKVDDDEGFFLAIDENRIGRQWHESILNSFDLCNDEIYFNAFICVETGEMRYFVEGSPLDTKKFKPVRLSRIVGEFL